MLVVRVGEVENGLLECLDLVVHLVRLDMRLELRKVVDSALAVGGSDHVGRVLPDVLCDLAPGGLDGGDGVGQRAVLGRRGISVGMWYVREKGRTMSKRTASAKKMVSRPPDLVTMMTILGLV